MCYKQNSDIHITPQYALSSRPTDVVNH